MTLQPKLLTFEGKLFIEAGRNYVVYVEPLATFLERTPEDKTRTLQIAVAKVQRPSKTIH